MYSFFENKFKETNELAWGAWSTLEPEDAIRVISGAGDTMGISLHPGNGYIQAKGFNVKAHPKDHGCDLAVYIFEMNKDARLFLTLWALMQNKRTIRGGVYKKEFEDLHQALEVKIQKDDRQGEAQAEPKKRDLKLSDGNNKHKDKIKSGSSKVKQKHLAIWKIIEPIYKNAGTYKEMQKAVVARKRIGKGETENIPTPSTNTLRKIIDKYGGSRKKIKSE